MNCVDEREAKVRLILLGASPICWGLLREWFCDACVCSGSGVLDRFTSRKPIHGLGLQGLLCRGACAEKMPGRGVRSMLHWGCGVRLCLCVVSALWRDAA